MYHVLPMNCVYNEDRKEFSASECLLPCCLKLSLCVWDVVNAITRRVVGQDSSVGIATRYGLDGPGIEFRWGRNFPHPSKLALGLTQPPTHCVPGLSWG